MPAFENEPQSDYVAPKRRSIRRYVFIGIGLLVLFGFGSCVWMFTGMFKQMGERQTATKLFVEKLLVKGMPPANDALYHSEAGITQKNIDAINAMLRDYGAASSIGDSECNINVSADSNPAENGTFSRCVTQAQFATTEGQITIQWKMQDEEWKLLFFNIHYDTVLEPTPDGPAPESN